MAPTPRLLLLLLVAASLGSLGGPAVAGAATLVLVVLAAAVADWWRLGRELPRVTAEREVADKLSLGAWNPVRLSLRNFTARSQQVTVRDVAPPDFRLRLRRASSEPGASSELHPEAEGYASAKAPLIALVAPPASGVAETYGVFPRHRGDHAFGPLFLRLTGALGLVRRDRVLVGTECRVRVYPNLRELRKFDLLARRGALIQAGTRPLRMPGASTEFERLRDYGRDDEYRRINWKATARRGRPIVNQLEAERSQNLVIMLDCGRLMAARATAPATDQAEAFDLGEVDAGLTKLDYALNTALLLAYVGGLRGDRVALLVYADEVRTFRPPARGRGAFVGMVQALYNVAPEPVEPDHGAAFQFLAARNLRRSLLVLFSDLADRESSSVLVARVLQAARHHQVVSVTLADPTVSRPAAATPRDAQSLYEKMVAQRLLEDRAAVLATLSQGGVLSVDTDADSLSPRAISTYLQLKERGRV